MRAMIIFEANILFVGSVHLGKSRTGCMNEERKMEAML
jgi:hypothetical protein